MIKAEKTGNKMELTITGGSHDLICEFDEVLKAMHKVLDESVVKSAPFTAEDILHTMAHNAAAEGKRAAWDMYERMADAEDTADLVARIYRSASAQIVFSAQDIFEKYMTKYKLSKTEAWRFLNSIQDKDSIQKLLLELKNKDSGENKQELLKELEAPAYRARIERLQGLLQQVDELLLIYKFQLFSNLPVWRLFCATAIPPRPMHTNV